MKKKNGKAVDKYIKRLQLQLQSVTGKRTVNRSGEEMKSEKNVEQWNLLTVLEPQPWGKIGTCFT